MTAPGGWLEVGERCWVRRYEPYAVSVGVVAGDRGLLVVDTRCSPAQGRAVREAVRALVPGVPVAATVATHWHFDHAFGLAAFGDGRTLGHPSLAERIRPGAPAVLEAARELGFDPAELVLPDEPVTASVRLDLGGRTVEVHHLGRGHTDGDLVVRVPGGPLFAGDLVEQQGPPAFGDDCYPLEWPATLDALAALLDPGGTVVPGHGDPVGPGFVHAQREQVGAVADEIRRLVAQDVPLPEALAAGRWPYPPALLADAVARGYDQLHRNTP